jgi:general secretion pathway protein A
MYQAFFGLREKPFNLTPDPKFLYLNASYREALASLHYAIAERKGFAALVGEAGTGKTTLLRRLLSELPRDTRSVLVINPAVGFEELLRFILTDLGRPPTPGTSKLQMTEALNAELLDTLARGGNVVVLIDEAQDLTIPVLEELRLLSNLETAKEKILQLVLAGQPELEIMLARPEIRQLRQRIAVNAHLRPLGRREVQAFVAARIAAAGGDERGLFRPAALYRLWRFSRGVPRLVNVACDNALVTAYAAGKRAVGWKAMGEAVRDLTPAQVPRRSRMPIFRLGTVTAAAILGAGGAFAVSHLSSASSPAPAVQVAAAPPPHPVAPPAAPEPQAVAVVNAPPPVTNVAPQPDPGAASDPAVPPPVAAVAAAPLDAPPEPVPVPESVGHDAAPATIAAAVVSNSGGSEPPSSEPADIDGYRYVRVERGDTITALAQRHYGYVTPEIIAAIQDANPALRNPDVIAIGGTLVLPPAVRAR